MPIERRKRPAALGRYDILGLLGEGGMGTVYEAVDREHGNRVALKALTHLDPDLLLQFKTEYRAVADLAHPNLVRLYELSVEDGLWYFTMERIVGVPFSEWIRPGTLHLTSPAPDPGQQTTQVVEVSEFPVANAKANPVSPLAPDQIPRLRQALGQLIEGVRALHQAGLMHLDLKPANVLVDEAGRVVILDFGLVRALRANHGLSHRVWGTPIWMAPEQMVNKGVTPSADWYAVGLMLYQALTGNLAFPREDSAANWYAKQHLTPDWPRGVPEDLAELAMALLHPQPESRPDCSGQPGQSRPETFTGTDVVGRQPEKEALERAFTRACQGKASLVQVSGQAGVGKTAVLDQFIHQMGRRVPMLVLAGRCYEWESVPYKAFDRVIDELARLLADRNPLELERCLPLDTSELCRLFPVLARVPMVAERAQSREELPAAEVRRRAVEALRQLLARLGESQPVVIPIDDFQWSDGESCSLLLQLLEPPQPKGLMLIVSLRPREASENLNLSPYFSALSGLEPTLLTVEALLPSSSHELTIQTLKALGMDTQELGPWIARESEGIPLFIQQLAHHLAQSGSIAQHFSLESVLTERIRALPERQQTLIELLAVADSPIPISLALQLADLEGEALPVLWSLQRAQFLRTSGSAAEDRVELHHDRIREAARKGLSGERHRQYQMALGRALRGRVDQVFDVVRHLNPWADHLSEEERRELAESNLEAGRRARHSGAFPLAYECFQAPTWVDWESDYELALALHCGAAETAYLTAEWRALETHVSVVQRYGRGMLDQLPAWEALIDGWIARREYSRAVETALRALVRLEVVLPTHPSPAEIAQEFEQASQALEGLGKQGVLELQPAQDQTATAAIRLQLRIGSAVYFARPELFPVLACRMVCSSVSHGLTPATPYALSVYAVVLNSCGRLREGHEWGQLALRLLDRLEDRSLEARTRHVVHDLVCVWTVPLASTLDDLRMVVEIGRRSGDVEYAAYAGHAYVHNAFYASLPLPGLQQEAQDLGQFMRGFEQTNALHVHAPFEQALACFLSRTASLDGPGFSEEGALETARQAGSRSAQCIIRLLMGMVRYHFGCPLEASDCLEQGRPFLDGVASTWHQPIFHQYAALALLSRPDWGNWRPVVQHSLQALRDWAEHCPANFQHRVDLVEGALALAEHREASEWLNSAARGARDHGWWNDLALIERLAGRQAASEGAYERWGCR